MCKRELGGTSLGGKATGARSRSEMLVTRSILVILVASADARTVMMLRALLLGG